MPTYHYRCKSCLHEFEEFQSMSEDPLTTCPGCGKDMLVRVISGAGLVFKGSGFYLTDYKKRGDGGPAKGGGATVSKGDASKEGSTKPGESKDGPAKERPSKDAPAPGSKKGDTPAPGGSGGPPADKA